jgi:hypothetical protein
MVMTICLSLCGIERMAEKTVEIPPLRLSLGVGRVAPLPPYQAVARQYITSETEGRWSNQP